MGKTYEFREQILKESEAEMHLKSFLSKINMFFGEEVAISSLSLNSDIVKSLNEMTTKFKDRKSLELAFILIRGAVLSNSKKNFYVEDIKARLAFGEFQDIVELVTTNIPYRKGLTRNLICQSKKTDKELYDRLENKNHIIEDLDNLRFYEYILNEKEKENNIRLVKRSK